MSLGIFGTFWRCSNISVKLCFEELNIETLRQTIGFLSCLDLSQRTVRSTKKLTYHSISACVACKNPRKICLFRKFDEYWPTLQYINHAYWLAKNCFDTHANWSLFSAPYSCSVKNQNIYSETLINVLPLAEQLLIFIHY